MWVAILFGASGTLLAGLLAFKTFERSTGTMYAVQVRRQFDAITLETGRIMGIWSSVAVRAVSRDVVLKGVHGVSMILLLSLRSLEGTLTHWVVRVRAKRRTLSEKNVRKLLFSATHVDRGSRVREVEGEGDVPE